MKVGCIGKGMVGNAIFEGLKASNHDMTFYDPKYPNSCFEDIVVTDCCFICVPTPPNEQNECDVTILVDVLDKLKSYNYSGVICIKSTIIPGTTDNMIRKYMNDKICFCPEFLKERCAYDDFMYNNPICVIGTESDDVFEVLKTIHNNISKIFKKVKPIEAELTKYMQNIFNTYKIIFANGFYEICKHNDVSYNSIVESLIVRNEIDTKYIHCSDNLRGPSGPCLVKDCLAFNEYVNTLQLGVKPSIFQTIVNDMKLYPKTVIDGTRTEIEYFGKKLNDK